MTNHEFREELIKELQKRMPGADIFPQDTKKNNGVVFSGIIIRDNSSNVAPNIYTEGLYYDYQNGNKDMDGVIDSVLEVYEKMKPEKCFNISEILDYSNARSKLNGRLVNTEKNSGALTELPHRNFFDLSLTYFVDVTRDGDEGCASIQVTNAHMEHWDVTEDDLYKQFKESMEQNDRSRIQPVMDALAEMANCPPKEIEALCGNTGIAPMYVLSNARKLNGAVEILNKKAMEKAAEAIGDDFYILPSSIHETILVPVRGKEDGADRLAEMVACINSSEVPDTEILSNHVYRYRRQSRQIELAA